MSHVAYLRYVKEPESVCVEVAAFGQNYRPFLAQVVSPFTTRVSGGDTWRCKYERLKTRVCTISLSLQCIRGALAAGALPRYNTKQHLFVRNSTACLLVVVYFHVAYLKLLYRLTNTCASIIASRLLQAHAWSPVGTELRYSDHLIS